MPKRPKFPSPEGSNIGQFIKTFPTGDESIFSERLDLDFEEAHPSKVAMFDPEKSRKEALRLMGLDIEWEMLTKDEEKDLLKSAERIRAYNNIETTTHPAKLRIEQKRGIISEILRKKLLSEDILKRLPTVYFGSGTDVEYPLSLGARHIELVDYMFTETAALEELRDRLSRILGKKVEFNDNGEINIDFDFGEGPEKVNIRLSPKVVHQEGMFFEKPEDTYIMPDQVGLVIFFASQGPEGRIVMDKEIESRVVPGGAILYETSLMKHDTSVRNFIRTDLGKKSI